MDDLAKTLQAQGDFIGARKLEEQVMEGHRAVWLGEDHPANLTSMNNLAIYAWGAGRLWRERGLYRRQALEAHRRVLGEDDPRTLTSMNNLASTRRAQGRSGGSVEGCRSRCWR